MSGIILFPDGKNINRDLSAACYQLREKAYRNDYPCFGVLEMSRGNSKVGKECLITNPGGPAHWCLSRAMGFCQLCDPENDQSDPESLCYAMRPERFRPGTFPFRVRQLKYWEKMTVKQIVYDMISLITRANRYLLVEYIRLSEASDVRSQKQLNKILKVFKAVLKAFPYIKIFGFTARRDLDFSGHAGVINWMSSGGDWTGQSCLAIPKHATTPAGYYRCPGSCSGCWKCAQPGARVAIPIH